MKVALFASLLLFSTLALACPVGHDGLSKKDRQRLQNSLKHRKVQHSIGKSQRKIAQTIEMASLPTAKSAQPWGGPGHWRPEAVLANAASQALNRAWGQSNVDEVRVSAPVKMIFTGERVYGDGQTNAGVSLGDAWSSRELPLLAVLIRRNDGTRTVHLQFSKGVELKSTTANLIFFVNGQRRNQDLSLQAGSEGLTGDWKVPADVVFGDLEQNRVLWVHPEGSDQAFPIDFRIPIVTTTELIKAAGSAKTAGHPAMDPMGVQQKSEKSGVIPEAVLLQTKFGPEWVKNDQGRNDLRNESIHGEIHTSSGIVRNAVGGGLTWLVDHGPNSTFKNLYTCFDERSYDNRARQKKGLCPRLTEDQGDARCATESQYGVPSGGGWHEIGDAAETIINSVESSPLLVGFAAGLPSATPPDGLHFGMGLSDVATLRLLRPEEAVMTPAGDQTWKEDETFRQWKMGQGPYPQGANDTRGKEASGAGRYYHWFIFPTANPVCTQEWVHNCRPTLNNNYGLTCP